MRIVYIHRGYFPSLAGAEIMARMIAGRMQQRGHMVQLLIGTHEPTIQHTTIDGISLIAVPTLDMQTLQHVLKWQPEIIHAIDAVDTHFPQAAWSLAQKLEVPFVITPASALETWEDPEKTMALCRTAQAVFVLTNAEAKRFCDFNVDSSRLIVTGQGAYLSGLPDPVTFRQRFGITGPLVLFLGRKVHFKGYQLLLKATRHVWARHDDTTFLFVGPRWDPHCLDIFHSFADHRIIELEVLNEQEKYSALSACDMLCLPTSFDVFPLVLVEAWTCSKPVIITPFPGATEVVRDRIDGLIAEAHPLALSRTITALLDEPQQRLQLGTAGRKRVERELNWDIVIDRIEEGYLRCL